MIAALLLATLLTRTVEQSDVFHPTHTAGRTFEQTARLMQARPLQIRAGDGVMLRGFLVGGSNRRAPYAILFYGNAELAQFEDDRLVWLRRLGLNAVCFDYRGYGYSGGTPDGAKIRDDSLRIYDYVTGELEASHAPAFVYGVSLGTQFAIHVAAQRPVRGLVLQSPAASATEELDWYGRRLPLYIRAFVRLVPSPQVETIFQGAREIRGVIAPLLVVHGAKDELIPPAQGREVYAAAASRDKRFVEIPDAGHGDIRFDRPPAGPAVAQFLTGR